MTTYNWTIAQLDRQTGTGGVVVAHWRVTAIDGDYSASAYGTAGFTPDPDALNFVPFEQITEADVLVLVWAYMDKDAAEASLATQIETLKNPPVLSGLPW